jgi:hypothetical protein
MSFPDNGYDGAGHFATNPNFEVQRSNHFEVVLNLSDGILGTEGDTISEHIRLSVKSVNAPKVTSEQIMLKHGNDTVKVAAAPQFEDLSIQVHDTLGLDQINAIQKWYNRVFDWQTKLMGMVSNYKTSGILYMYSPDGKIKRQWILEGVWPKAYGNGTDFSYESAEAQSVTLDLSVDRYHEEPVSA